MTLKINDIADYFTIPKNCQEIFFLQNNPELLASKGVKHTGWSHLYSPYKIGRVKPGFHLVLFVVSGNAHLQLAQKEIKLKKGDILFIPIGTPHLYYALKNWEIIWFHLDGTSPYWNQLPSQVMLKNDSFFISQIESITKLIINYHWQQTNTDLEIKITFFNALTLYLRKLLLQTDLTPQARKSEDKIHTLLKALDEKINHAWSIEEMSSLVHLSSPQLFRIIKNHFRIAPMELLAKLRATKAKYYIQTTNLSIKEIAPLVGYQNQFSFSRAYKKWQKESPQQTKQHSN